MPITDGHIQFDDGSATVEVFVPEFGYKTEIILPFDISRQEDGTYDLFDHGTAYDKRVCGSQFVLDAADQNILQDFFKDTAKGRSKDVIISMNSDSGFFPFGPDKGDVGPFTVAAKINPRGINESPLNFFRFGIEMSNTGSWPAYSIPVEVSEGNLRIGDIENNRFPPAWFDPKTNYGFFSTIEQDSTSQYIDRGALSDNYQTKFTMESNQTKAANVIEHLVDSVRTSNFLLVTDTNYFPFGRDKTDAGTFTVKLIQDKILITHQMYDRFKYDLNLSFVSVA